MTTEEERAAFDDQMSRWQAYLDRYQATRDHELILSHEALAQVRELPGWATGSATWSDAQHVCAWFHWLRYQLLSDGRGTADRQAAEQLFRDQYRTRPADIPEPVRERLDGEFQRIFAAAMAQVAEETRHRRPNRRRLEELMGPLQMLCNMTTRGDPQYFDRLDARAKVAQLCRSNLANDYQEEALKAHTKKGCQPSPANPPWRPFDWKTYFGM